MSTHRHRYPIRVGTLLWPQRSEWTELTESARLADELRLDSLWTWDHLHAIVGDPLAPIFEGWTTLAAWAVETEHIQLGLMVGANTFRNPGLTAKTAVTVDHISGGRLWLGLGGAWFEYEHTANGIDFGSGFGQRLDWLDEAVEAITRVLEGEVVTSGPGAHYDFAALEHHPLPYRGAGRLPLMIGGGGEKKTLRTVARYAQAWNVAGGHATLERKARILREHCAAVGRDPLDIEHSLVRFASLRDDPEEAARALQERLDANGSTHVIDPDLDFIGHEEQVAADWRRYLELGFTHLIVDLPAPVDRETLERLPRLRELVAAG
jgi:alkanesulfonate monooxygenase SsuD/methylene tetrahydromethanopterin reductase-like flavin-dependent oxidoreductase (luciferase family)